MEDPVDSNSDYSSAEKNNLDIIFMKDLLRYVFLEHYDMDNFKPEGFFKEKDGIYPFVEDVKSAVEHFLDKRGEDIQVEYDIDFQYEDEISQEGHLEKIKHKNSIFENKPFDNASFLEYLCRCAEFTRLSYVNGITEAPDLSLRAIYDMLYNMRQSGKISQDMWSDFIKYCFNYAQAERPRVKPRMSI